MMFLMLWMTPEIFDDRSYRAGTTHNHLPTATDSR